MPEEDATMHFDPEYTPKEASTPQEPLRPGMVLGTRYRIDKFLGQGGMGAVWLAMEMGANETEIQQVVLKVVPPELQRNKFEMDKIQKSFELVRKLRHPNICSALTFALDEKYGYFLVMDYVPGIELSDLQLQQPGGVFTFEQTVEILAFVAVALDYAHKKKILHRDVKPQNVMVPIEQDVPQIDELKLIDFGLASEYHSTQSFDPENESFSISGTLPYMPPEQISGSHQDSRTDQYALGVMAYQMLSGRLPFTSMAPAVLMHKVMNSPPDALAEVPPHVNSVLCRVMAKNRNLRYDSCVEFVNALKSGKVEKPVSLSLDDLEPPQKKPSARPKTFVWGGVALLLLVCGVMFGWMATQKTTSVAVLEKTSTEEPAPPPAVPEPEPVVEPEPKPEPKPEPVVEPKPEPKPKSEPVVRTKRRVAVCANFDWVLSFHDVDTGRTLKEIPTYWVQGHCLGATVSPDGRFVAYSVGRKITCYDTVSWKPKWSVEAHPGELIHHALAFSPDSSVLYSCGKGDSCVKIWKTENGELVRELPVPETAEHRGLALSPDGRFLACATTKANITLWDTQSWKVVQTWPCVYIGQMVFSRDNTKLLLSHFDGNTLTVQLRDIATGTQILSFPSFGKNCRCVFTPDEKMILASGNQNTICLWDIESRTLVRKFEGNRGMITSLACPPEGDVLVSSASNGLVCVWDIQTGKKLRECQPFPNSVLQMCLVPESMSEELSHKIFGKPDAPLPEPDPKTLPSLAGRSLVATIGWDNNLQIRDRKTDEILRTFPKVDSYPSTLPVASPNGKYVAVPYQNQQVYLCDIESGKVRHVLNPKSFSSASRVLFSPDSSCIFTLTYCQPGTLQTWDVETGECLQTAHATDGWECVSMALSPDGTRISTAGVNYDSTTQLETWDTSTWKRVGRWSSPKLVFMQYSRDGKTLVSLDRTDKEKRVIRFWDVETGKQIREIVPEFSAGGEFAFSKDEKILYVSAKGGKFQALDAKTGAKIAEAPEKLETCFFLGLSPDGKEILSRAAKTKTTPIQDIHFAQLRNADTLELIREYKDVKFGHAAFVPDASTAPPTTGPTLAETLRESKRLRELAMKTDFPVPLSAEELAAARKSVADQLAQQATAPEGEKKEIVWPTPYKRLVPPTDLPPLGNRPLVATVGKADSLVKIWDAQTGEKLRIFEAPKANAAILCWSPDAKLLAVASTGGFINVWEVETGKKVLEITENGKNDPSDLIFDKEGKRLFSSVAQCKLRVWNVEDGAKLAEIFQMYATFFTSEDRYGLALSEDGSLLVANYFQRAIVWDAKTYKKKQDFTFDGYCWHPKFYNGNRHVLLERDGKAILLDVETGKQLRTIPTDFKFTYLSHSMGENLWCSYDDVKSIFYTFHPETGETEKYWNSPRGIPYDLSQDETTVACKTDGTLFLYDLASGDCVSSILAHDKVCSVRFAPNYRSTYQTTPYANGSERFVPVGLKPYRILVRPSGAGEKFDPTTEIITGNQGGGIFRVNLRTGEIRWKTKVAWGMRRIQMSPDGTRLSVSLPNSNKVTLLEMETGKILQTWETPTPSCASFSPDGKTLAVTGWDNRKTLDLISLETGKKTVLSDDCPQSHMNAWSPDGTSVVALSQQKIVAFNVTTGEKKELFDGKGEALGGVAFSPDGKWLAVGIHRSAEVLLYHVPTGELKRLPFDDMTTALIFSSDSQELVACSFHGLIQCWSIPTLEKRWSFKTDANTYSVAWSADEKYVISAHESVVRIWNVETGERVVELGGIPLRASAFFVK
ncbi:MAG: protein kinase [Planctomycetia bacterium]|nr:protein kinase [Planctomycetia bacterium]